MLCIIINFKDFTMNMYTLVNYKLVPNMKYNRVLFIDILAFKDFYNRPRLLINMQDIVTKINSAHLRTMDYTCTTYELNPMCRF